MTAAYLAVSWPADASDPVAAEWCSATISRSPGWVRAWRGEGLEVWTHGAPSVPVFAAGALNAVLIGRLHGRDPAAAALRVSQPCAPQPAPIAAQVLIDHFWGAYVAIIREPGRGWDWGLRDPSGALDALTWTRDGVKFLASDIEQLPSSLLPTGLCLDWDVIADLIRRPTSITARTPLRGLETIAPGDLQPLGGAGRHAIACWRPATWARQADRRPHDLEARLRQAVGDAVSAALTDYDLTLMEVSGGLDSAVVATTAENLGLGEKVVSALHVFDRRPESDERVWARLVRDKLGRPLAELALRAANFTQGDLQDLARGARPTINGLDISRDRQTAKLARDLGATALVTGKGGDAVFFQNPTALLLSDYLAAHGRRRALGHYAQDMSRRLRRSVWSVAWEACQALGSQGVPLRPSPLWGPRTREPPAGPAHPWLAGLEGLPPAKREQIEGIVMTQANRGASRYGRVMDLLHPLMAQPVLELALSTPVWALVPEGRDRGLVRRAFAQQLPREIVDRRSKGEMSAYYAHVIAENLPFLRAYLLEGVLVDAGVLDRKALDGALSADALIYDSQSPILMTSMAVESWVRHWQTQVPDCPDTPRRRV